MNTSHYDTKTQLYWSFDEARQQGLLSRSRWRNQWKVVPDDARPAGIVVQKTGRVLKSDGEVLRPIVSEDNDCLIVALNWFDVFSEQQAIPKEMKSSGKSLLLQIFQRNSNNTEGGGAGSSLMMENKLQVQECQTVTPNGNEKDISEVNKIRTYVPEGLSLPINCPVKHQIWWFLGLIYWKHLEARLPWSQPVSLKGEYLRDNFPNWTEVWRYCYAMKLVERSAGYTPGEKSYGYSTALPYRVQTHRLTEFENKALAKQLRTIETKTLSRPVLKLLRRQLDRLSVDMEEFQRRFGDHQNRHYYHAHLQTICDRQLRFTKDEFSGRIHTSVTNLYKPLRRLLRVDSETATLGETDIKNSQPLFLGMAARAKGIEDQRYMGLCEAGEIYDHLAYRLGVLRESAKHEMVMLLYAKNGYKSTAKRLFEIEFPEMAQFIHKVKDGDHKRLARRMQEAERRFVIDSVCPRLFQINNDLFVTTIHDAIVARKSDCDLVVSVLREEFSKKGVSPRLEWKDVADGH
jgi:hypothetical protein